MNDEPNLSDNQGQAQNWLENSENGGAPIPEFRGAEAAENQPVNAPDEKQDNVEKDQDPDTINLVDMMNGMIEVSWKRAVPEEYAEWAKLSDEDLDELVADTRKKEEDSHEKEVIRYHNSPRTYAFMPISTAGYKLSALEDMQRYRGMSDEALDKEEASNRSRLKEITDWTMRGEMDHLNEPMYRNTLNIIGAEQERRKAKRAEANAEIE